MPSRKQASTPAESVQDLSDLKRSSPVPGGAEVLAEPSPASRAFLTSLKENLPSRFLPLLAFPWFFA